LVANADGNVVLVTINGVDSLAITYRESNDKDFESGDLSCHQFEFCREALKETNPKMECAV